jgi:predicted nucleic acid-binding protein
MRAALDTNVLAYAEGVNGAERKNAALELIAALPANAVAVPVQVLGELFQVLLRKASRTGAQASAAILAWRDAFPLIDTSGSVIVGAAELVSTHRLSFWDGVILAATAESGCRLLLSEDLQDGFTWNGVTVANPFAKSRHPLLENLLIR